MLKFTENIAKVGDLEGPGWSRVQVLEPKRVEKLVGCDSIPVARMSTVALVEIWLGQASGE